MISRADKISTHYLCFVHSLLYLLSAAAPKNKKNKIKLHIYYGNFRPYLPSEALSALQLSKCFVVCFKRRSIKEFIISVMSCGVLAGKQTRLRTSNIAWPLL